MQAEFQIFGFHEAVASVRRLDRAIDFFQATANWQLLHRGTLDPELNRLWRLPVNTSVEEALLGAPGENTGFLRLLKFDVPQQLQIRSNAQTWDSGGILDFNVRVADMDAAFSAFQREDWQGVCDPVDWQFGPFRVKEWLTRGPDSLSFALIERIAPPLEGWDLSKSMSRIFNSSQTVKDMQPSLDFYRNVLGFQETLHHQGSMPNAGPNVLAVPHQLIHKTAHEIVILHPQGGATGSVELISLPELGGYDFSERAVPPNLGALALRFPVKNLTALQQSFETHSLTYSQVTAVQLEPYGAANLLAVQAPEGAWLEFVECGAFGIQD